MAKETNNVPSALKGKVGYSGTLIFNGIITGEEYNRDLIGPWGNRKFEIMRRSDSTIRGALQVVKLPVLSTTWKVEPVQMPDGTITPDAQEKADFLNRELFGRNVNWHDFLHQALTCLDFGHSVFEKELGPTQFNGKFRIGIEGLWSRKQITIYSWEADAGRPGITQFVGAQKAYIIREKLIYFIHEKEGDNFNGVSLLRYVYKDWDIKDKLTLVNAMAIEKLGLGIITVKAREGMTPSPADRAEAKSFLANLRANNRAHAELPDTMELEMLDMKGQTVREVIPTLNYHDARIMKSILAGFLELGGSSGSGSQSLSKDLTSLFMKSEEALANIVVGALGEDLIKQLCDLNWSDMSDGYPKLSFGQIADDDVSVMSTSLKDLADAGLITPDAEIEDHLRGAWRLPLMSKQKKASYEEDHKKPDVVPVDPKAGAPKPKDPKKPPVKKNASIEDALDAAKLHRNTLIGMLAEG